MARLTDYLNPSASLGDVWDELGILKDRALDRHLRVAVTGLSRSGKTVFITSLVHHLLDGNGLPFLEAVHDGRYLGAPAGGRASRRTGSPIAASTPISRRQPPRWPQATDRLARCELELAYRTRSLVLRQVQPIQHLTLEIIDYPGEWLLDLPLLEEGFAQFSRDAIGLAEQPVRRAAAGRAGSAQLRAFDPDAPEDEAAIAALSEPIPPISAAMPSRAWAEPGPARPVHQPGRPRRLAAAALLPVAARRAASRHQPCAHGRALRALPRGGGAAVLRGAFQPLRSPDRAGRPAGRAECRPGPFRRHRGDAGA